MRRGHHASRRPPEPIILVMCWCPGVFVTLTALLLSVRNGATFLVGALALPFSAPTPTNAHFCAAEILTAANGTGFGKGLRRPCSRPLQGHVIHKSNISIVSSLVHVVHLREHLFCRCLFVPPLGLRYFRPNMMQCSMINPWRIVFYSICRDRGVEDCRSLCLLLVHVQKYTSNGG
jgi:hypothetical protein